MIRVYCGHPDGTVEAGLSRQRLQAALADEQNLVWVDIEDPEDAEVELLLEVFELHPLTVEDCIMPNARPKVEDFDRYLFLVLQGLTRDDGRLRTTELDVCLGKNFLITVRSERLRAIEEASARVEKKSPIISRGPDFLFYAIYESLIDSYFPILDEMEARVDELEAKLLADASAERVKDLLGVYHDLSMLRRTLAPHREIASRLNRGDVAFIRPNNAAYFRDIFDHVLRMSDLVDGCREVTTITLEAHATLVSNRLNGIVKTMTALATLAMPLLVITGIYGMNFGENPGLGPRWIYHAISYALLGSIPVMLYYFWKYRWL